MEKERAAVAYKASMLIVRAILVILVVGLFVQLGNLRALIDPQLRVARTIPTIALNESESSQYRVGLSDYAIGRSKRLQSFVSHLAKEGKFGKIKLPKNFSAPEVINFGGEQVIAPAK